MSPKKLLSKRKTEKRSGLNELFFLGLIFVAFIVLLIFAQANVQYSIRDEKLDLLPKGEIIRLKNEAAKMPKDCNILVVKEDDPTGLKAQKVFIPMLDQMKENYDLIDIDDYDDSLLETHDTLVLIITKYTKLNHSVSTIKTWVRNGGNLMIAYPPEASGSFQTLFDILGIKDGLDVSFIEGVHVKNDFMIGGNLKDYMIEDPYDSSFGVVLTDDCEVFLESTGDYPVPLVWRRKVGEGTIVFDNFGIMEKGYRGFHAAAFSLLDDYCVYPVINSATFYIDDFPSPVPEGDAQYITRDYNMSIADFYSQVWWKNVYDLSRRYDINYTGVVIENYSNQTKGKFEENTEVSRFKYFGNMLLKSGGEIGIHGYNHMPLVLENFDYKDEYDEYIQWSSTADMENSLKEVYGFAENLFPDEELIVYVPPSNILSKEGRKVVSKMGARSIGAVYLGKEMAYEQEFDVDTRDGIINTPRIVSGYNLDDYMQIVAFSELNFHYVSTHFQHPDDVLDEDRGAALGWETLYSTFENYLDWLYNSAPDIRNLTGSELAGAVERYDLIVVNRKEEGNKIVLEFDNFLDECWMMLRLNENQSIKDIEGGEYKKVAENLYLIECGKERVEIELEK